MKKTIWISYDLGVTGDYESLYAWLDTWGAIECGDSFAYIPNYSVKSDLMQELRDDIKRNVNTDKRTRIYVIREEGGKPKGKFLIGARKSAPWVGYAPSKGTVSDDEG